MVYGGRGSCGVFFFQAEDGIRDLVRSRGLGDVYKRQVELCSPGRAGDGFHDQCGGLGAKEGER